MSDRLSDGSRRIVERIVVTGELLLETPAHFGGDDQLGFVDMALVRDPLTGDALLPGASIAGALRSYLRTCRHGYSQAERKGNKTRTDDLALLFGYQQDTDGSQSSLLTADAYSHPRAIELRDNVAINPVTRTADDKKKFNIELLAAGTVFDLRIELLVRESAPAAGGRQAPDEQAARMVRAFAQALQGFERGEIALGARKRRGFGQCRVAAWQVKRYDLRQPGALLAWLSGDRHGKATFDSKSQDSERSIVDLLPGAANPNLDDKRAFCTLTATFQLEGSLLIRSGGDQPNAPDMVHLKSLRGSGAVPVLSGSSLAGALRARALRIAKTVGDPVQAEKVIACLFGALETASRIWVEESEIHDPIERVVTRLKIDRFTGGAYPNALFSQQPLYSGEETRTTIKLRVEDPNDADIGIILLLLKDLWTGDLAVGGEASVGRGRLCGKHAELHLTRPKSGQAENMADIAAEGADQSSPTSWSWVFRRSSTGGLNLPDDAARLQKFVNTFLNEVQDEHA